MQLCHLLPVAMNNVSTKWSASVCKGHVRGQTLICDLSVS